MKIKAVFFSVLTILVAKLALACDPLLSSCSTESKSELCKVTSCFANQTEKEKFEKENNCQFSECSDEITEIPLEVLKQIFPSSTTMLNAIADELNMALKLSATQGLINTKRKLAHLLAQVKQEIGSGAVIVENLDYSELKLSKFSYYKKHPVEAQQDGRTSTHPANQEAIANKIYANRLGNGNVASGDGWKYRGRGIIQLTGKYNYQVFTTEYNKIWGDNMDFIANPDEVLNPKYAVRSALVFWKIHNLSGLAEKGISEADSNAITKVVNIYTPSYLQRFNNLKAIMSMDFFKECVK